MAALKKVVLSVVALIIVAAVLFVVFEEEISSYLVGETTTVTGIVISEQMESSREMIPWQAVLVRLRDNSTVEALVVPGCKIKTGDHVVLSMLEPITGEEKFFTILGTCTVEL